MAQANISVRIDEKLKKQFEYICQELGLTMSSAINMFAKAVVRENKIPLDLSLHTPNEETRKVLDEVDKGIGLSKVYTNLDEMWKDLDKVEIDEV